jgi:hypothetical protein
MTHSARLNDIRELAERFRRLAGTTGMPDYAELLSATAGALERRAVQLEAQPARPQGLGAREVAAHARVAACSAQAA